MIKKWRTPAGEFPRLYDDMLKQHHLLVAGQSGSGKSVIINGLIYTALYRSPANVRFILIDPKRVELARYAGLEHTITHAKGYNPKAWLEALQMAVNIMDARYTEMEKRRLKVYNGSDIYVIIDEYAQVALNGGKECYKAIMRLTSEGRAAKIHCIIATQVPKANIIKTEIRENMTGRVCLHCNTKNESRVLMDIPGCECLPQYGKGFYITANGRELYSIPMIDETRLDAMVDYWHKHKGKICLFG